MTNQINLIVNSTSMNTLYVMDKSEYFLRLKPKVQQDSHSAIKYMSVYLICTFSIFSIFKYLNFSNI